MREAIVAGVDRKVEVLRGSTERRAQQASAAQARRYSRFLNVLSFLTVVTVAVALITYFFGSRSDALARFLLRIIVVASALTAAAT